MHSYLSMGLCKDVPSVKEFTFLPNALAGTTSYRDRVLSTRNPLVISIYLCFHLSWLTIIIPLTIVVMFNLSVVMFNLRYLFICDKWLATDKEDGRTQRTLVVSSSYLTGDTTKLMKKNMSQRIFEDHMWFSVAYRAKKSLFSRAQRLGACMATLFLAMISNAMFFKDSSEQQPAALINIGPISITGPQLYNSIMSSLIVLPPVLLMTFLFSRAKPKKDGKYEELDEPEAKGQLPHWCSYIGWVLVFIYILVSAVFTIFYSMSWGKEKSLAWLQTFFLSFIESAIIIQPVKVCMFNNTKQLI